jgi:hypothetical protein
LHESIDIEFATATTHEDATPGKACQGNQHSWPERNNNLLVDALFRKQTSLNIDQDALPSLSWCYSHVSNIAAERPVSRLIFLPVHTNTFAEDEGGFSLSPLLNHST